MNRLAATVVLISVLFPPLSARADEKSSLLERLKRRDGQVDAVLAVCTCEIVFSDEAIKEYMERAGLDDMAKARALRDHSIDVRLEEGADARWRLNTVVLNPDGQLQANRIHEFDGKDGLQKEFSAGAFGVPLGNPRVRHLGEHEARTPVESGATVRKMTGTTALRPDPTYGVRSGSLRAQIEAGTNVTIRKDQKVGDVPCLRVSWESRLKGIDGTLVDTYWLDEARDLVALKCTQEFIPAGMPKRLQIQWTADSVGVLDAKAAPKGQTSYHYPKEATWVYYSGLGKEMMTQRLKVKSLSFQPGFGPDHFRINLQNIPIQ